MGIVHRIIGALIRPRKANPVAEATRLTSSGSSAATSLPGATDPSRVGAEDPHGQPFNVLFNRARRTERDLSELLGLAKGMLSDGVMDEAEATYLRKWGNNHPDALAQWPTNMVFARLNQYFTDGRIDQAERLELHDLLSNLVSGTISLVLGDQGATTLPLDAPPPLICWGPNDVYVFTGRFAYGTRADCEREVRQRGGSCEERVTRRTSFMVIGTFGSRDWAHSSFGRKIQRAVKLRAAGSTIRIVGEDHWANALSPLTSSSPAARPTGLSEPKQGGTSSSTFGGPEGCVDVVGESFYQDTLRSLDAIEGDRPFWVRLVPEQDNEHDPNAVAVVTEADACVGYLSRAVAKSYHKALLRQTLPVFCPAKLTGRGKSSLGVVLDFDQVRILKDS